MNNKGQSIFGGIVVGIVLFIVGMVFLNYVSIDTWVDGSDGLTAQLDCDQDISSISDGAKATCLASEIVTPYLIFVIGGAAIALITARLLL